MWNVGYLGIWRAGMQSPASWQLLLDLAISCVLISVWIKGDAEQHGLYALAVDACDFLHWQCGDVAVLAGTQ